MTDAYPEIYRNRVSPDHPQVKAWSASLSGNDAWVLATDDVTAPTPALALLLAMLKALEANHG